MMNFFEERKSICNTATRMLAQGLVVGTWGNISLRLNNSNILITPSALNYEKMEASDLMLIDLEGKVIEGKHRPSSEMPLHLAIYKARKDVCAIVHTHSTYATALAVARVPLPPIVEDLMQAVGGGVEVAPYAHPGSNELAVNCTESLNDKNAVLLANHGVVGVGKSLEEAYNVCQVVEKAAHIFLLARTAREPYILDQNTVSLLHRAFLKYKNGE